jgi:hypothetical protein
MNNNIIVNFAIRQNLIILHLKKKCKNLMIIEVN